MGQRPRPKPKYLAAKLLQIRHLLGLSQSQLATQLDYDLTCARISEYESGKREPNLLTLLAYARLAEIPLEHVVDDNKELTLR